MPLHILFKIATEWKIMQINVEPELSLYFLHKQWLSPLSLFKDKKKTICSRGYLMIKKERALLIFCQKNKSSKACSLHSTQYM